jgi:hypothetical protein
METTIINGWSMPSISIGARTLQGQGIICPSRVREAL